MDPAVIVHAVETIGLLVLSALGIAEFATISIFAVETIGLLALSALGIAEFATISIFGVTTVAAVVGTAITAAALIGASYLLGGNPKVQAPQLPNPSDGTQTLRQAVPPRIFGYGRARIAGAYMLYEATTSGDSYDVIVLHHGRVEAILYYYLHDDLVMLDANGAVDDVVGVDASDFRYVANITIQARLGNVVESTYAPVVGAFPTQWTGAHRGDGQASVMMKCTGVALSAFWTVYPHGLPKLSVVADLTPVFDPRDTAQSRDDPSSWRSTQNPVLQLIDLMTSTDHGLGLDWATVIEPVVDDLMAEADICDEDVDLASGVTEPRYRSSGFAYLNSDAADIMAAILLSCDGWMTEGPDGTLALKVGQYRAPTITLTDEHILGFTVDHGIADEEAVNEIRFNYTPPANDYKEAAGDPWQDTADIAERGKVRSQQLPLTWVPSHSQARRLAKRTMLRYLARLRGTMVCNLYGLALLGERWVAVQSNTIADLADAVVEVSKLKIDVAQGRVSFDWALVNVNEIDAWDETTEEGTEPLFLGKAAILDLPVPANIFFGNDPSGKYVTFDETFRPDLNYSLRWISATPGEEFWRTIHFSSYSSDGATIQLPFFSTGIVTPSGVQVATRNSLGQQSEWSTGAVYTP